MLDGPDCVSGYRHVWHSLQLKGHQVPRKKVETILRELDPDGCQQRKEHKLKRREYHNPGPNAVWHADGYDKLKPYGLSFYGWLSLDQTIHPTTLDLTTLRQLKHMVGVLVKLLRTWVLKRTSWLQCKHSSMTMKMPTGMPPHSEIKGSKAIGRYSEETGPAGG